MTLLWQHYRGRNAFLALAFLLIACPGCREDEPGVEVLSIKGKIEKIELQTGQTGEITVLYYNEKQGKEALGTGLVTADTEIMINGALAKLSDLREGDRVRGDVRVEKTGDKTKRIILKIHINRPKRVGGSDG